MVLRITSKPVESFSINDKVMTPVDFADPATHPYIASKLWEHVYIDVDDPDMPTGLIRQLVKVYTITPVINDVSKITVKGMLLLGEIYPDEIAKLRAFYMKDRTKFVELVNELIK